VRRDSDAICVDVRDRGTGMRADVLARAAEPLFTTKAERGGAGLGLYLVQVICEALGGQLALDSSAGGGTRASLSFRVSQVRA
jgi:signal transduction histidine kinase